jgi:acetoin utilization protein AcuB
MMDVPVKSWMSGDPIAIEPMASALDALELMVDRGIRHLPVVDPQQRVVGVLSIDDLRAGLPFAASHRALPAPAEREAAREWRVSDLMTHAPATALEGTPLAEAAQTMAERRIGCLPIVDAEGRLAGLLSETDVLHALATSLWSDRVREQRGARREFDALKRELGRERAALADRLDGYHAAERELSADLHDRPTDAGERGFDQREVTITERLDELAARRLEAIDRALDHAAQGRLGTCDRCGGAIPVARLRAVPGTTLCVACARASEEAPEPEVPFERVPGGRAETGHPELGAEVETHLGEGQLLRIAPFGTCRRCGDVEGRFDEDEDAAVCDREGCHELLEDVNELAVVRVGEREVYVDPRELRSSEAEPYD